MCKFASFLHNPLTKEIKVADLDSHGNTEKNLKLDPKIWREGHYTPAGEIELRFTDDDRVDQTEYKTAFVNRFPTFISFLNWALSKIVKDGVYGGSLGLNGLTSAQGLKLPAKVDGSLDLNGLTSAQGLKLPAKVGGYLDLNGLTSAQGLKLPAKVGGSLYLNGLTSAQGLKLPAKVDGSLYLNGLTSAQGLKLPAKVEGSLGLNGLTSAQGLKLPAKVGRYLDLGAKVRQELAERK